MSMRLPGLSAGSVPPGGPPGNPFNCPKIIFKMCAWEDCPGSCKVVLPDHIQHSRDCNGSCNTDLCPVIDMFRVTTLPREGYCPTCFGIAQQTVQYASKAGRYAGAALQQLYPSQPNIQLNVQLAAEELARANATAVSARNERLRAVTRNNMQVFHSLASIILDMDAAIERANSAIEAFNFTG